jgi:hypothetical protein
MGRGRAKAKQTKVARQLKYSSGGTDLERLRAELLGEGQQEPADQFAEDEDDLYARYADVADDNPDNNPDNTDGADDRYGGNGRRTR